MSKYIIHTTKYAVTEYIERIDLLGSYVTDKETEAKRFSDLDVAKWVCEKVRESTGASWTITEVS